MIIRDAASSDAESILAIYAPFVRGSAISFEAIPPGTNEMAKRINHSTWRWPWLVAEVEGSLAGYAYARPFRGRSAYHFTAESTVYVSPDHQRQGVGKCLMQHLLNRLYSAGHHRAVVGIALPNEGSVALHERLGFEPAGVFPSVGRKFQSWHDVGFWSLELSDQTVTIPDLAANKWRMRVHSATSSEAQLLIAQLSDELAERYDQQDDGSGNFAAENEDGCRSVFVAGFLDDSPVACGAIRPLENDIAELKRMFVVKKYRGRKLSSRILQRLEVEASRLSYRSIRLETGNRQPEAIGLYEKSGYQRIAPYGQYVASERSICFEKPLDEQLSTVAEITKTSGTTRSAELLASSATGKPPIVTIHGGFDGGWAWEGVAARLRSFGHSVRTPTLTGSGERAHLASPGIGLDTFVNDITNVIRFDDLNDVVLVAHSAGGIVASGVVQRIPERIRHVIFLDALVPVDGESAFDLLGEQLAAALERAAADTGCEWKLPHNPPDADRRTDVLLRPLKDRIQIENNSFPSSYIAFTDRPASDPFAPVLKRIAQRMQSSVSCHYREADLPHFPMLDQPDVVAGLIREEIVTRPQGRHQGLG